MITWLRPSLVIVPSTNIHPDPQSAYKQYIPSCLLAYKDSQYIHYKSPLTTTQ